VATGPQAGLPINFNGTALVVKRIVLNEKPYDHETPKRRKPEKDVQFGRTNTHCLRQVRKFSLMISTADLLKMSHM
jgi:hypothetical protein